MSNTPNTPQACVVDGRDHECGGCIVINGLTTLFRFALGALFIFSGYIKLNDPQAFAFAIKGFKLVENHELISHATFSIPWTEVLIGVLVILGLYTRVAAGSMFLMLAIFTGAVFTVLARDIDTTCGCFGKYMGSKIDGSTITRNCVLLAVSALVFYKRGGFLTLDGWRRNQARAVDQPS